MIRELIRWGVTGIIVVHGLIHLMGAAKGLGWADVPQLAKPISTTMGVAWLAAGVLVLTAGVLLAMGIRWWWVVGAVAAMASQSVILTSWGDAKAGTAANVVLVLAVVYGFASQGPTSFRAEYRHRVSTALEQVADAPRSVVTEADLDHLPDPVAAYVRRSGAVGQPRISNFRARIHGQIRAGAREPWMSFTGEQVNTYGPDPSRLFFMDATMRGLPVDVLHAYVGPSATMRVKLASVVPMVDASGPEMDVGETVTLFNDLCLLAPGALVDAPVRWQPLCDHHVRGFFSNGDHTVSADLVFDDDGQLVDFVSDDRLRNSPGDAGFTPQRWSTPVLGHRTFDSRRVSTPGEGRWHAPEPEGTFAYLELDVDDLAYNIGTARTLFTHREARYGVGKGATS